MSNRRALTPAALLGALVVLCSCSLWQGSYTTPDELCGYSVPSSDTDALLPDGENLTQEQKSPALLALLSCSVFVDDDFKLDFEIGSIDKGPPYDGSVEAFNESHPEPIANASRVGIGRGGLVGSNGAVALVDCRTSDFEILSAYVRLSDTNSDASNQDLEAFIRSLVSSAKRQHDCPGSEEADPSSPQE